MTWSVVFTNWEVNPEGKIRRLGSNKMLAVRLRKDGYLDVKLGYKRYLVHRLVAQAFIPNPKNKLQVNHVDGKRHNAHVSNLEWATQHENMQHAFKAGLFPSRSGEKNGRCQISKEMALEIKNLLLQGKGLTAISKYLNVKYTIVANIKHGKAWKDLKWI